MIVMPFVDAQSCKAAFLLTEPYGLPPLTRSISLKLCERLSGVQEAQGIAADLSTDMMSLMAGILSAILSKVVMCEGDVNTTCDRAPSVSQNSIRKRLNTHLRLCVIEAVLDDVGRQDVV